MITPVRYPARRNAGYGHPSRWAFTVHENSRPALPADAPVAVGLGVKIPPGGNNYHRNPTRVMANIPGRNGGVDGAGRP